MSPGATESAPLQAPRPRWPLWAAAGLGGLTIAVYAGALGAGFYSDDYEWLGRMTPALERPGYLFRVFYRDFNPLLHASFVVDYLAGGGASSMFHATSLLVHAVNTALLVLLCTRLAGNPWASLAMGLLWGTGVRISEAVIWPAARGHSLAALFVLAALLALAGSARYRVLWAGLLFAAALLTKETALFPMLLAPAFVRDRPARRNTAIVVAALAVAFVVFNVACKPGFDTTGEGPGAILLKLPFVVLRPIGLGDRYDFSVAGFALFAAAAAGLLVLCRRSPAALLGLLWIVLCAVEILPLQKVSSRYLYLMSIGYPLLACGLIAHPGFPRLSPGMRRAILGLGGLAAGLLAAANIVFVQREIADYRLLAGPYRACFESLRGPASALAPGETLIVAETEPRTMIRDLTYLIEERGNIRKLIPERDRGVGGLIALPDLINAVRPARTGSLAVAADPDGAGPRRILLWDGRTARTAEALPDPPAARVLAAKLVPSPAFFEPAPVARP
ncbi:MAG TPA: hypothetical protein VKF61_00680 [Candidatus Polarisedimenticolia bacterium]|nr:hypothetical protein [Candidatus Polarisedimenticolia bacterium]